MLSTLKKKYALTDTGVANVLRGAVWTCVANLLIMCGLAALFLAMDGFMAHCLNGAALPDILPFAIGLAVFFIALFGAQWAQYTFTYVAVYNQTAEQRLGLAERLRKLPLSFFTRRDLADLTETVMSDVAALEHMTSHVLSYLYGAVASTVVVSVGLLCYNWQLAIAALWSVPAAFLVLFALRPVLAAPQKRQRAMAVEVSSYIQSSLECMREIRATNQERSFVQGLADLVDAGDRHKIKVETLNGLSVNAAFVVLRIGIATTLLAGASMVAQGQIGFMTMFAFLLVVSRIYSPFDQALMLITEMFISQTSAERLNAIYSEPLAGGSESFKPQGHDVVFNKASFSYHSAAHDDCSDAFALMEKASLETLHNSEPVLENLSFAAREGEVTALVGPSGSGKSTCAKLAARFWDVDAGSVSVGGVNVATVDPEALLGDYAVVFQDVLLFDDTVMANIRVGRHDATDEEVRAAARAARCDEFVERLPKGYDTMIGENGSKLSGGERQRISIARALLKDAPIVLLDEATASLDVENETLIQAALTRLLASKTVIVIAHRMRTVEHADKIVVLDGGRIVEEGTPDELIRKDGAFAHMVRMQKESAAWVL